MSDADSTHPTRGRSGEEHTPSAGDSPDPAPGGPAPEGPAPMWGQPNAAAPGTWPPPPGHAAPGATWGPAWGYGPPVRARSSGRGCAVAALLFGLILAVTAVGGFLIVGGNADRAKAVQDTDKVLPVPGEGDPLSWIVTSRDKLMRVEAGREDPLWRSDALENSTEVQLALDDRRVFVSADRHVLAFDLDTGATLWDITLPDRVEIAPTDEIDAPACPLCFTVVDDRLIVSSVDWELHALDPANGKEVWNHRFFDSFGRAVLAGGSIVLIDQRDEGHAGSELTSLDPSDGTVIAQAAPTCEPEDDDGRADTLHSSEVVLPVAGEEAVIVEFEDAGCRQRIDMANGRAAWSVQRTTGDWPLESANLVQHDGVIDVRNSDGGVDRIDLADGGRQELVAAGRDEGLLPLAMVDDVLLVRATLTRGSRKYQLVGVNADSGERLWTHALDDVRPGGDADDDRDATVTSGAPVWYWAVGEDGTIRVLTYSLEGEGRDMEPTLHIDRLDATTGKRQSRVTGEVEAPSQSFALKIIVLERRPGSMVVNIDGTLQAVDTGTGKVTAHWP